MNVKEKSNWTNSEIKYLKNCIIVEYDLHSGGLSVIKQFNLLPKSEIEKLDEMEKKTKNITIGKIQARNKDLSKSMVEGFGIARKMFVDSNGIPDENILSIKKDALFLINCSGIDGKVSDYLEFRKKNTYTSYMNLNRKEFYFNPLTNELDVKGISDNSRELQKDYLLKDIKLFMKQSEKLSDEQLYENLKQYRSDYLNKNLPYDTYRNLDTEYFQLPNFSVSELQDSYKDNIDISYNYIHYVLPMIQCLLKNCKF